MRRLLIAFCCLTASLVGAGVAFGAQAPKDGEKGEVLVRGKFRPKPGETREEGERVLHLNNPEDRKFLTENMDYIEELERVESPDLFALKRWDLGVWSILIFVLLFLGLSKFAWKPMVNGLQKREQNIRGSLEMAEKTRQEAAQLQTNIDAKNKEAGAEIAKRMENVRRSEQEIKEKALTEAKAEIQKERDRFRREMDTAKDQALTEIWQQSVTLAASMSSKALRRTVTDQDHRRLLDESLAELKQAGGGVGKQNA